MAASSSVGSWHWLRFSLRELFGLTALVLIGLMSLMHASAWVPNFWFSLLLLSLGIAIAVWRAGRSTGFCEGYVLFAGGYALLLLLSAWPQMNAFMANPNAPHTMLITHSLNDWAYDHVLPLIREAPPALPPGGGGFFGPGPIAQFGGAGGGFGGSGGNLSLVIGGGQSILGYPDSTGFHRVAHCLWAIAIGCAGGRFKRALRAPPSSS